MKREPKSRCHRVGDVFVLDGLRVGGDGAADEVLEIRGEQEGTTCHVVRDDADETICRHDGHSEHAGSAPH